MTFQTFENPPFQPYPDALPQKRILTRRSPLTLSAKRPDCIRFVSISTDLHPFAQGNAFTPGTATIRRKKECRTIRTKTRPETLIRKE